MNDLNPHLDPVSVPTESSLLASFQAVQRTLQLLLLAVLVIGGCFTVFLWRQQRDMNRQLTVWKPYVHTYDTVLLPMIDTVRGDLLNYAKSHPDIDPILDKYDLRQLTTGQTAGASALPAAPPVTPRPQTPLPPKK
jgi:hypothetical protein